MAVGELASCWVGEAERMWSSILWEAAATEEKVDGVSFGERAYIRKRKRRLGRRAVVRHNRPALSGHSNLNLSFRPPANPCVSGSAQAAADVVLAPGRRSSVSALVTCPRARRRVSPLRLCAGRLPSRCINYAHMSSPFPGPETQTGPNTKILKRSDAILRCSAQTMEIPASPNMYKEGSIHHAFPFRRLLRQRCFGA